MHGTTDRAVCISCYQPDDGMVHLQQYLENGMIPQCRHCGGIMKPDVILTGEQLPVKMVMKAKKLLHKSNPGHRHIIFRWTSHELDREGL